MKDLSDAALLERFRGRREEAAFALLVQRHGPAVLGVCRRLLGDIHAAEDAFQATFLVLVRNAGSVRKQHSLGSFLCGVAYRTAARARFQAAERRMREREVVNSPSYTDPLAALSRAEASAILYDEMERLPAKYRQPLVLCYLEGKTHEQAAQEMAWPKSSVAARLKRGCELLRQRLSQRGIVLPAGALAALLADQAAEAVTAVLTLATVRVAAQALAGSAVRGASATRKIVILALLLTVGLGAASVGILVSQQQEPKAEPPPLRAEPAEKPKAEPVAVARTDLYGDPLPDGALARLGTVRLRQAGMLQLVFSDEGKTLFSTGLDNHIRRWEVSSGKLIGSQPITLPPDDPFRTPEFHDAFVPRLALSPDGRTVAIVGPKHLFFLDAATGKEVHRVARKQFDMDWLTFTADSKQVAYKTFKGELLLFDVATGRPVETGLQDQRFGRLIALDPNGKMVAAPGDRRVNIWELPGGKLLRAIPTVGCRQIIFSPDGKRLLLASSKEAIILNIATAEKEAESPLADGLYWNLCFSPDGAQLVVSSEDSILFLDTKNMKEIRRLRTTVGLCHFQFSPDGKTLAAFSNGKAAHLWNVADGKLLHDFPGHNDVWRVVYSPDGKSLASGGGGVTIIWDLETKKPRTTIRTSIEDRGDKAFIFSADGQTLFAPANSGTVKSWKVADGTEIATYLTADDEAGRGNQIVTSLHVSHDGKRLTACSWECGHPNKMVNYLVTWDVPSGNALLIPAGRASRTCLSRRTDRTLPTQKTNTLSCTTSPGSKGAAWGATHGPTPTTFLPTVHSWQPPLWTLLLLRNWPRNS
jgi:RNA polymerase sigma factor (sigma-70 family)